jgi:hypothetical protein
MSIRKLQIANQQISKSANRRSALQEQGSGSTGTPSRKLSGTIGRPGTWLQSIVHISWHISEAFGKVSNSPLGKGPSLALDRVAGGLPRAKAAEKSCQVGEPKRVQLERRTGAGLLGRSGTVQDDLFPLGQLTVVRFDLVQGNGQGTWNVKVIVGRTAAGVDDDHVLASVQEAL